MRDLDDSGPYCKHWDDPGSCEECMKEGPAYKALLAQRDALVLLLKRASNELAFAGSVLMADEIDAALALVEKGER